jgi:hypothetical protein
VKNVAILVAVFLGGISVRLIFLTATTVEADSLSIKSSGVDVFQLHQNVKNLPVQKIHDVKETAQAAQPCANDFEPDSRGDLRCARSSYTRGLWS